MGNYIRPYWSGGKWLLLGVLCTLFVVGTLAGTKPFQQIPTSLKPGAVIERELKGGETHSFQIALASSQFLYAVVDQKGIDVVVTVFGPDGKLLLKVDSPNGRIGPEPVVLVADAAGDYRLDVSSINRQAPAGRYGIKVMALRDPTPTDKNHAAAERAFEEAEQKLRPQRTAASRRAAIEKYQQALQFYQSSGDGYRRALTLFQIGATHMEAGEPREAMEFFIQALPIFRALGEKSREAATLNFIGGASDIMGDLYGALDYYNQALTLARSEGSQSTEASLLNNIGKIHSDLADWQKSLEYYNQALPLVRGLGDQRREAITIHNIGVANAGLGEAEKALEYYRRELPLRKATKDKSGEADALSNMGLAYAAMGETQNALEHYNQALSLRREVGDSGGEGDTLSFIGAAYLLSGAPQKAIETLQQALQLSRKTNNRRLEAFILGYIGRAYTLLDRPEKAIEYDGQALAIFRSIRDRNGEAMVLQGVASAERDRGNIADALKTIEAAILLFEEVRARATSEQLRASYLARRQDAYQFQIDLLMQMHRREPAAGYDARALQTSERARARSLLEMLTESHADIGQGADAALLDRERELMQKLNAKALRRTGRNTPQQLEALNQEISQLESEYLEVQTAIRRNNPHYAAITQPEPIGLKEIQGQLLDQNSLLLEYALGEERSYLWAVTNDSITGYELPKRELIQKVAAHVTELLTARGARQRIETPSQRAQRIAEADAQLPDAAKQLSEMILAPAAAKLSNKRLLIVPDGPLQYVPFAMLPEPATGRQGDGATGRKTEPTVLAPLVVDHELVTLPSASTLAVMRKELAGRMPAPKMLAVFADPVFAGDDERSRVTAARPSSKAELTTKGSENFAEGRSVVHEEKASNNVGGIGSGKLMIPRLPFTRQEADRILAVTPNTANLKAVDFRASRAMATGAELSQYRYLHFATHGLLDTERPGLSALVLSLVDEQGKPQDGFLRVHEIYNLNLPAELVVLSACQTGLGKEYKGEGLVGLTRGFMYAGAARVVVSLWNVNDRATAELMPRFYQKMLKEGQGPAAALRSAQVEMWRQKQWQAPYYWAAFVLQGEWK